MNIITNLKNIFLLPLFLAICSSNIWAAGGSNVPLLEPNNNLRDIGSLRRGAELFVNRCTSCHSAKYIRYSVIAEKLLWNPEETDKLLIKGRAKFLEHMVGGMSKSAAQAAFGTQPPDLTLTAKVRGTDWLYTFLQAYYQNDEGKMDNYVFPGTAMPPPFIGEQGIRKATYHYGSGKLPTGSRPSENPVSADQKARAAQKESNFKQQLRDLVNFMEFISEPQKTDRWDLGTKVILFLLVLLLLSYLLKKEFWRDIKEK